MPRRRSADLLERPLRREERILRRLGRLDVEGKEAGGERDGCRKGAAKRPTPGLLADPLPQGSHGVPVSHRRRPLARTRRTARTLRPDRTPRGNNEPYGRFLPLVLGRRPGSEEVERGRRRVVGGDLLVEEELEREPGQHQGVAATVGA